MWWGHWKLHGYPDCIIRATNSAVTCLAPSSDDPDRSLSSVDTDSSPQVMVTMCIPRPNLTKTFSTITNWWQQLQCITTFFIENNWLRELNSLVPAQNRCTSVEWLIWVDYIWWKRLWNHFQEWNFVVMASDTPQGLLWYFTYPGWREKYCKQYTSVF